jgi:hypothetical protein
MPPHPRIARPIGVLARPTAPDPALPRPARGPPCLWTFRSLDAAAHLYRRHGFRLAGERPGRRRGTEMIEQRYMLGA